MNETDRDGVDPVQLTARLVRCPSVTPNEGGALQLIARLLNEAGFRCHRVDRNGIPNLFARWGSERPVFGFNGHTDVVPVGDHEGWNCDPFGGEIRDGCVWGRGATDMKSGVAAFIAAAVEHTRRAPGKGSVIITITGDEEALATDGTIAILDWMDEQDQCMDVCLVGEPTCPDFMGQAIKIGRRGTLSVRVEFSGRQGHSAYPDRFQNPLTALAHFSHALVTHQLDEGTAEFPPSHLAITAVETDNSATNVVPAHAALTLNIRFNDLHSRPSLLDWLDKEARRHSESLGISAVARVISSADCFLTKRGPLADLVASAVEHELGIKPQFSTTGGTSDARFIAHHCPVVEFGLTSGTIHQVDERARIKEILELKRIYSRCLDDFFS